MINAGIDEAICGGGQRRKAEHGDIVIAITAANTSKRSFC
jgi:hypothetical protein